MSKALVFVFVIAAASASAQTNLLSNGQFESRQQIRTMQRGSCNDMSSAKDWSTWIQAIGCVPDSGVELATDVVLGAPVGKFAPAPHIIHVRSNRVNPMGMGDPGQAGISQVFDSTNFHNRMLASVWVYVVSGKVGLGVGYTGSTKPKVGSTKTGDWELLVTLNETSPASEFVLYGVDPRGSEFYAADAVVCPADTDEDLKACTQALGLESAPALSSGAGQ